MELEVSVTVTVKPSSIESADPDVCPDWCSRAHLPGLDTQSIPVTIRAEKMHTGQTVRLVVPAYGHVCDYPMTPEAAVDMADAFDRDSSPGCRTLAQTLRDAAASPGRQATTPERPAGSS